MGLAVGSVGFKSGFSKALIDSWESFTELLGQAGLPQYIILYEMLICYGFVMIFRGWVYYNMV
jgi:hypothetical protein